MKWLLIIAGLYLIFKEQQVESVIQEKFEWPNVFQPVVKAVYDLDKLYIEKGMQYGLDPGLLKAIAQVESNENPNAVNPNDPSYGLMQVLYPQKLNVNNWPPDSKEELFDPCYNLDIACQILRWNIDTYGIPKGIAIYNAWSARNDPPDGPFVNQSYVDKVTGKWRGTAGTFI